MRFSSFSRIVLNGMLFFTLSGLIPIGTCLVNTGFVSPTSSLSYTQLGNVTYRIEIMLELSNGGSAAFDVFVFNPHIKNWSSEVPDGGSSLQSSILLGNSTPLSYNSANFSQTDKFNNSIDYYTKNLLAIGSPAQTSFILSMNYTVVARQIRWDKLGTPIMTDYDNETQFYKLYTQNQPSFINITDPAIILTAAMICGGNNYPVEKARAIYNWICANISYEVQIDEMGASWALTNLKGDCSEFSDLMIAFLRAQCVPARKVVGLGLLDPSGNRLPSYGQGATWIYYQSGSFDNYTGHAWVEYFVPGSGWVACDPTWGHNGLDYFNYIDYLHISSCRGEYFGDEVVPSLITLTGHESGEYPIIPHLAYDNWGVLDTTTTTRFTVVESNIWVDNSLVFYIIGIAIIIAIVGIVSWALHRRRQDNLVGNYSN